MSNPHNIEVGQKLFFVRGINRSKYGNNNDYWVTVEKIGRKWAKLSDHCQVNLENLVVDGGRYSSPGRCYLSDTEYFKEREKSELWGSIWRFVRNQRGTPDLPTETLKEIAGLLKIEPSDRS